MGYGTREPGGRIGGDGPIEMLTVKLGLSQEQKIKVTDILEKTRQEIDGVRKNTRSAIEQIKEKNDKQIMSILTPEQQTKFKALQKEFGNGHGPRGQQESSDR